MKPQLDQNSTLLRLPGEIIDHILRYFSVKELVRLQSVCHDLNRHVLLALASVKTLPPYLIPFKDLRSLLPKLKNLSIIDENEFHWECFTSDNAPTLANLLGQFCPNIEYIHLRRADADFILQYTQKVDKYKLPVKIKIVALYIDPFSRKNHFSPALLTLLKKYELMQIRAIDHYGYFLQEFQAENLSSDDVGLILSRTTILSTRLFRSAEEEISISKFLRSLVNLKVLAIKIPLWHVPLIGGCSPLLEHFRLEVFESSRIEPLEILERLISTRVPKFASFGLEMRVQQLEAERIVELLVAAKAKFRHYPDPFFHTLLRLGGGWDVALLPYLKIKSWPPSAVNSLFDLFQRTDRVRIYQTLDKVDVFLCHFNHVRVLSIPMLFEQLHLIAEHCPKLRRLKILNSQLYESMKLEKLHTFITTQAARYESFSLVINATIPDDEARKLANLLVQAGAKFRSYRALGSAELKLGARWHFDTNAIPSCASRSTVYSWPRDDFDLLVALINPLNGVETDRLPCLEDAAWFAKRLRALGFRVLG